MKNLKHIIATTLIVVLVFSITTAQDTVTRSANQAANLTTYSLDALRTAVQSDGMVRVIVTLDDTQFTRIGDLNGTQAITQVNRIATLQNNVLSSLAAGSGDYRVSRQYQYVPQIAMAVDLAALDELVAMSSVLRVQQDKINRHFLEETLPIIGVSTQGGAWDLGYTGSDWAVAVLDDGLHREHPFFDDDLGNSRLIAEACFSDDLQINGATTSLCPNGQLTQIGTGAAAACSDSFVVDGCTHGTHVAGIALGADYSSSLRGVAPDSNLISINVFTKIIGSNNCNGPASCIGAFDSDVIAGLEHVLTLHNQGVNVAAVNMSLGGGNFVGTCDDEPHKAAMDNLLSVGIATVVASGNAGQINGASSPACISTAIGVSSTTDVDTVSGFSNVSGVMDLFAPGSNVNSALDGTSYGIQSGTSMAAPHVAGAFALLRERNATASVSTLLATLKTTGTPIVDLNHTLPRINVDDALTATTAVPVLDVNDDARTSVIDAIYVVNRFGETVNRRNDNADINNDYAINALDALLVLNSLAP